MSNLKKVLLSRFFGNDKQTLGVLSVSNSNGFVCKTLELPDKNNASQVSCIPSGVYICKYTKSPLFSQKAGHDVYTYEIQNVPNRGGIRIHSANYARQLLGCVALGDSHKDIDSDGQLDVIHSGDTVKKFEEAMNKETFELTIVNNFIKS
jgi:hypothetical protein